MKNLILLISALTISISLSAQSIEDVNVMWKEVLAGEKQALIMHTDDYELHRMANNRTTTPQEPPYPQMQVLLDSMMSSINRIQEFRREFATKRDALMKMAEKKKKPEKSEEVKAEIASISKFLDENKPMFDEVNAEVSVLHDQFSNLEQLFGVKVMTYGEYFDTFMVEMESIEKKLVDQGSKLAEIRVAQKAALDNNDLQKGAYYVDYIEDLTELHDKTQAKYTQVQNFQNRLETTNADEILYFGPGIDPPYELKTMRSEFDVMQSYFDQFDFLYNEAKE